MKNTLKFQDQILVFFFMCKQQENKIRSQALVVASKYHLVMENRPQPIHLCHDSANVKCIHANRPPFLVQIC